MRFSAFFVAFLCACTPPPVASLDATEDAGDSAVLADAAPHPGFAPYTQYCALCHGARGEGYAADHANALTNPDFLRVATDAFLLDSILEGRPGTPMSAWSVTHGGPLDATQAMSIIDWLRSTTGEPQQDVSGVAVLGDVARGRALYASSCASCHGPEGQGVTAVSLNHENFQRAASDGFLRHAIENGRVGTAMASYRDRGAQSIDDLVVFVRTLRRISDNPGTVEGVPPVDRLVINPGGANPSFVLREGRYVPAAMVRAAMLANQRMILIDARPPSDWVNGHIPGAAPFPFYNVDTLAMNLPTDGTWIVAYCGCPHAASGQVVDQLRARGFANTAVLDEGVFFWRDAGYPIVAGRL